MKTCLRCKQEKLLNSFHSRLHKSLHTGEVTTYFTSLCKDCNKLSCAERRKSPNGMFTDIFNGQLQSSKARKHIPPTYTEEELRQWIEQQPHFHSLLQSWIASKYDRWLKPSVDRLNDDLGYSFDNIQLMTWRENFNKKKQDMVLVGDSSCRKVIQYQDGIQIAVHHSLHEAARVVKGAAGNILRCCTGQYKTSKGFTWRYLDE